MCVYVRNRWPHRLTPRAEIWHGVPHIPLKGQRVCLSQLPPPLGGGGQRVLLEVRAAQMRPFWESFIKQKLKKNQYGRCGSGQIRSQTSPRCLAGGPSARGASAGMVPWLSGLKLDREVWTQPGRSMPMFGLGTPTPRSRGS